MSMELISVIVPVYNVEQYAAECLTSITKQSYPELEILLIDDGSEDGSGKICDAYAEKDSRFQVIHQENRGLSAARNTGIDLASGKYLMFVDSDDILEAHIIEHLYALCENDGAQIAVCGFLYYNGKNRRRTDKKTQTCLLDRDQALQELCQDRRIKNFAWGKLYDRRLFEGIRYPQGQLFEDINTTYRLFEKSTCIAYTAREGYYYRIRSGAITQTRDIYHALQRVSAHRQRYEDLAFRQKKLASVLAKQLLYSYVMLAKSYVAAEEKEQIQQASAIGEALDFLRQNAAEIEKTAGFDAVERREYQCLMEQGAEAFEKVNGLNRIHRITKRIWFLR